jgi:hypothetical protein
MISRIKVAHLGQLTWGANSTACVVVFVRFLFTTHHAPKTNFKPFALWPATRLIVAEEMTP